MRKPWSRGWGVDAVFLKKTWCLRGLVFIEIVTRKLDFALPPRMLAVRNFNLHFLAFLFILTASES